MRICPLKPSPRRTGWVVEGRWLWVAVATVQVPVNAAELTVKRSCWLSRSKTADTKIHPFAPSCIGIWTGSMAPPVVQVSNSGQPFGFSLSAPPGTPVSAICAINDWILLPPAAGLLGQNQPETLKLLEVSTAGDCVKPN